MDYIPANTHPPFSLRESIVPDLSTRIRSAAAIARLCAAAAGLALACASTARAAEVPATSPGSPRERAYLEQMRADQSEHPTLAVGSGAPDFKLLGTDGKPHSLNDYKDARVLVVVFISNHCPASQLYEARIKAIAQDYRDRGVRVVAIAPNGPLAATMSSLNFTDVDDSVKSMKIRADYGHFNFDYLYDGDTQAVSHRYGPKVTPHLFVFDEHRVLRYEGRIDDRLQPGRATTHEARDAIDSLLAGKPVAVSHTAVFGCSTKWNSHRAGVEDELAEWNALPVNLEVAPLADLSALRPNHTGKMLMVNFWATWCAPCQAEYPMLLETYLWYRSRDFDFVSVSLDAPEAKAAVQKFLNKTHSAIRNLGVDTDDVYAVMKAFDPSWESGVPFTIVIAADGTVAYQHAGEVDRLKLRRAILARLPDAGMFAGNAAYWQLAQVHP